MLEEPCLGNINPNDKQLIPGTEYDRLGAGTALEIRNDEDGCLRVIT